MDLLLASAITNIFEFFMRGGFFMIFLVIVSLTMGTVVILRAMALRDDSVLPPNIVAEVERLQPGGSLEKLELVLSRYPSPLARVLTVLLTHLNWSKSEAQEAVQTRARHEFSRLERGLVFLEVTTGISPLLGLLGTLSGLVSIFATVGGSGDPVIIAKGISEALNTTIVGLAISVPSLVAYSYFQRKIEVMSIEMESLAVELLAKCYSRETQR